MHKNRNSELVEWRINVACHIKSKISQADIANIFTIALDPVNDDILFLNKRLRTTTTSITHMNNRIPEYQDVMTEMK